MICNLCPRNCNAVRNEHDGSGFCGAGTLARVTRVAPHYWEEPPISGVNGSGTVFFSGCSLGCVFCQNQKISRNCMLGQEMNAKQLSTLFSKVEDLGVHNINLVTPTHFAPVIIEALSLKKPGIPIIWNSSGYEKVETIEALKGLVDIFLPDFKFSSAECSSNLANAPDYFPVALTAIKKMCKITGSPRYDENGIMLTGTVIRHLVLPLRVKETYTILDSIAQNMPKGTPVSLMKQYTPLVDTKIKGLGRPLTSREYRLALQYMLSLGLTGFTQDSKSIAESFVPDFLDEQSLKIINSCLQ